MNKTMLTLVTLVALLAIATGAFADSHTDAKLKALEKRLQKLELNNAKDRIKWTGDLRIEAHSSTGEVDAGPGIITDTGVEDAVELGPCEEIVGLASSECAAQSQESQSLEVNILLVMDKSGSMEDVPAGYNMTKWEALEQALGDALTGVQDAISFGLEFFPTSATPGSPIPPQCGDVDRCCEMPGGSEMNVNIGPGAETVPEIVSALDLSDPAGGTPTSAALARAYTYFFEGPGA